MTVKILNEPADLKMIFAVDHDYVDTVTTQAEAWEFFPTEARPARTVDDERRAFFTMLPRLRRSHSGKHVIVAAGDIADSDDSRRALIRRFFGQPKTPTAYVGFVGPQRIVRIPTPRIRRQH